MRRTLVLVSLAVTSMVALAFLIPLALTVREIARDRALTTAERQASALGPVLVVTEDPAALERAVASTQAGAAGRMTVHMPDGTLVPKPGPGDPSAGHWSIGRVPNSSGSIVSAAVGIQRASQVGGRLPTNASMPSAASDDARFEVITPEA